MSNILNITNERFGSLIAIRPSGVNHRNNVVWLCQCDCGNLVSVITTRLIKGKTRSCGCLKPVHRKEWAPKIGDRIGKVIITNTEWSKENRVTKFYYICDCGKSSMAWGSYINRLKSCGCHITEKLRTGYKEISGTYWYAIRQGAIIRNLCFEIAIEDAWNKFIEQSRKCALSGIELKFSPNKRENKQTASLDRINSSIGYTIKNIQWIHKVLNRLKGSLSDEDLLYWSTLISNHKILKESRHEQYEQGRSNTD